MDMCIGVFEGVDFDSDVRIAKFKMADSIWRKKIKFFNFFDTAALLLQFFELYR